MQRTKEELNRSIELQRESIQDLNTMYHKIPAKIRNLMAGVKEDLEELEELNGKGKIWASLDSNKI